jgi:hypothetical protein
VHDPLDFPVRDRHSKRDGGHLAAENGSFRQLSTEPGRPGSGLAAAAALVGLTKPKIPPPVPQGREREKDIQFFTKVQSLRPVAIENLPFW